MKKLMLLAVILTGMVLVQGCGEYMSLTGGHGGPTDSANIGIESNSIKGTANGRRLFGIGATCILNGDGTSYDEEASGDYSGLYDWERSIGTLRETGTYRDWPELGLYCQYGAEIVENSKLFVTVLGGFTAANEVTVYDSTIQVYPYSYGDTSWEFYGLVGGGLTYFFDNNMCLTTNYDNRRGFSMGFGSKF